ncbi:MAG: GNAT family N-acetyltransferase [Crocinitomicaceae bacterium]
MKEIIDPIEKSVLKAELNTERFLRTTRKGGNEIYRINCHNAPNVLQEIGRLRELTFRNSGGGTGEEVDLDEHDFGPYAYEQLIVWSPEDEEIIGGYRYLVCADALDQDGNYHLSTTHYFEFGTAFKEKYLPYTIELGRSWVQPNYQPTVNPKKGLFALDNIWDGLGALIRFYPTVKYFFGKVTMYPDYDTSSRDFLLFFLQHFFPDSEQLIKAYHPLQIGDTSAYAALIEGKEYKEAFKELNSFVRERGTFIPPLMNIYMNLSATMRTFDTAVNPDFGNVEETGILVTIADIYPDKKERHLDF